MTMENQKQMQMIRSTVRMTVQDQQMDTFAIQNLLLNAKLVATAYLINLLKDLKKNVMMETPLIMMVVPLLV